MPAFRRIFAVVFLVTAISSHDSTLVADETADAATGETPRAVVARWLQLHRTGNSDEASTLTTGSLYHRAASLLPSTRDTGVRVARSLGNERAAAVVTTSLDDARAGERVLLFWLVRRDSAWRINKSDSENRQVVDERLRISGSGRRTMGHSTRPVARPLGSWSVQPPHHWWCCLRQPASTR